MTSDGVDWKKCLEYFRSIASEDALFGIQHTRTDRRFFVIFAALVSILPLLLAFSLASEISTISDPKPLVVESSLTTSELKIAAQSIEDKEILSKIEKVIGRTQFHVVNEYSRSMYALVGSIAVFCIFALVFLWAGVGIYTRSVEKQISVHMNGQSRNSAIEYSRQVTGTFCLTFLLIVSSYALYTLLKIDGLKNFNFAVFKTLKFLPGNLESFVSGRLFFGIFTIFFLTTACTFFCALTSNFYARRYPDIRKHAKQLHDLNVMKFRKDVSKYQNEDSVWSRLKTESVVIEGDAVVDPLTTATSLKHAITKICFPLIVLYSFLLVVFWFVFNYLVKKYNSTLDENQAYIDGWERVLMASVDGWLFIIAIGLTISLFLVYLRPLIRLNPYLEAEESKANKKKKETPTILRIEFGAPSSRNPKEKTERPRGKIIGSGRERDEHCQNTHLSTVIGANEDRLGILLDAVDYGGGFHEVVHGAFKSSGTSWIEKLKPWLSTFSPTLLVGLLSLL